VILVPLEGGGAEGFEGGVEMLDFLGEGGLEFGGVVFFSDVGGLFVVDPHGFGEGLGVEGLAIFKDGLEVIGCFQHLSVFFIALNKLEIIKCKWQQLILKNWEGVREED
jgi:hypothetical protein